MVKSSDGQIRVETHIQSRLGSQIPIHENTRFQSGNRASLLAAVSLASLMGATAAHAQQAGQQLPTIDVTGDQGGGYQVTQQSITRLPTPLINTPQTVNVIPQQMIQDQRANSMEDALRNVTGITFSAGEGGQQGDSPYIRGFAARGDIFRDGMRDPGWYTRDLFSIDSVEVYKGPSSFAFGRGSTGGAINNVSKLPTGTNYVEGTLTGTSANGYRVDVDASGKKGNISGRVAALYQDVPTPTRDNVFTKRWGIAPSITAQVDDSTKATLSYVYQGEQSVPDYGFPWLPPPTYSTTTGALTYGGYNGNGSAVLPAAVGRDKFLGFTSGPYADQVQTETHIVTSKIERDLGSNTSLTNATRYMVVDRFASPTAPRNIGGAGDTGTTATTPPPGYPVDSMTIGLQKWQNETDNTQIINQTDLVSKFDTGMLRHTAAVGLELSRETRHQTRQNLCYPVTSATTPSPICRTSLSNPMPNPFTPQALGWGAPQDTLMTNIGTYASDQVKIGRYFEVMGSLRYDYLRTKYDDLTQTVAANQHIQSTDGMLGWRYGIVFHPIENTSLYFAHGTSFNPSSELGTLSTGTVSLAPEKTNVKEIGAKADVLDGGRLSLTAALFRIDKTNMRVPLDPTQTGAAAVQILDGVARSDGYELGVTGKPLDKWSVFVGFTQLWTQLRQSTDLSQLGRQLPNAPPRSFTLWNTYELTPDLTIGGGATYNSDTYANAQNTEYVPAYWKVDAMLSYRIQKNTALQLNVYNLTNALYYAQYYGGQAVPAPGRWASLSLKTRW
ncbi:MAG TPA: TonB-dependent receptor [Pseudolabrys sp.]